MAFLVGNNAAGSTLYDGFQNWAVAEKFLCGTSGTATSLWAYSSNNLAGNVACNAKMAIYSLSGSATTLIGQSNAVAYAQNQGWGWVEFPLQAGAAVTSSSNYVIWFLGDASGGGLCSHWDGTGYLGNWRNSWTYTDGFAASGSFSGSSGTQTFPFYATSTDAPASGDRTPLIQFGFA